MDINVDFDDVLGSMNDREKQEMCDNLYDDGYIPSNQDMDDVKSIFSPEGRLTQNESELADILINIWNNKHFINNDDIKQLRYYSKKGL